MIVTEIRLENFRNHTSSTIHFGRGINALLGDNGQGKTNVLEAVSYLSLTKSFFAASDAHVLQLGKDRFEIDGAVLDGTDWRHDIHIAYVCDTGEKTYTVDQQRPERLSSVIGSFPVVILSPEHGAITSGGPGERRKFIDILLSQVSKAYLEDLLEFRRVLRQRNAILVQEFSDPTRHGVELEPWTISLVRHASRIMYRRCEFVREFQKYVSDAYEELSGTDEVPGISYVAAANVQCGATVEAIGEQLRYCLETRRDEEQRRAMTLVGPHRDELRLSIGGRSLQHYASQGQHKTFLVALKLAEFFYLRERREESPLVLLDDVFSELDSHRSRRMLDLVPELGQTLITATDERHFHGAVRWDDDHRRFIVERGTVRHG